MTGNQALPRYEGSTDQSWDGLAVDLQTWGWYFPQMHKGCFRHRVNNSDKGMYLTMPPKAWPPIDLMLLECFFWKTGTTWLQISYHVCAWYSPWVWVGCLEGDIYSSHMATLCNGNRCCPTIEWKIWVLYIGWWLFSLIWIRYCHVPTFGCDTIWKFKNNASAMKKLARWDFEDLLQTSHCCINSPCD